MTIYKLNAATATLVAILNRMKNGETIKLIQGPK